MKNASFTGILGINFDTETMLTNVVLIMSIEKIVTKFLIFIFNSQGIDYQQKHIQMWIYEYCRIEFWILLKICYFVQIYFNFRRPIFVLTWQKYFMHTSAQAERKIQNLAYWHLHSYMIYTFARFLHLSKLWNDQSVYIKFSDLFKHITSYLSGMYFNLPH